MYIQQMTESTGARGISKSLIIKTSQLEDHQLILLCIICIVGLLSVTFLLKLSQSLPYRPRLLKGRREDCEEQDESSDKSATRGFASLEINPQ